MDTARQQKREGAGQPSLPSSLFLVEQASRFDSRSKLFVGLRSPRPRGYWHQACPQYCGHWCRRGHALLCRDKERNSGLGKCVNNLNSELMAMSTRTGARKSCHRLAAVSAPHSLTPCCLETSGLVRHSCYMHILAVFSTGFLPRLLPDSFWRTAAGQWMVQGLCHFSSRAY